MSEPREHSLVVALGQRRHGGLRQRETIGRGQEAANENPHEGRCAAGLRVPTAPTTGCSDLSWRMKILLKVSRCEEAGGVQLSSAKVCGECLLVRRGCHLTQCHKGEEDTVLGLPQSSAVGRGLERTSSFQMGWNGRQPTHPRGRHRCRQVGRPGSHCQVSPSEGAVRSTSRPADAADDTPSQAPVQGATNGRSWDGPAGTSPPHRATQSAQAWQRQGPGLPPAYHAVVFLSLRSKLLEA